MTEFHGPPDVQDPSGRQATRREYVQSGLYNRRLTIVGQLLGTVFGTLLLILVVGLVIAGLGWLGIMADNKYLPDDLRHDMDNIGPERSFAILYLLGPLVGIFSIWFYQRVNRLELAVKRRRLLRADLDASGKGRQLDELIRLEGEKRELNEKIAREKCADDNTTSTRVLEVAQQVYRRKERLLGFKWVSLTVLVVLVTVNWLGIVSQLCYDVRWFFTSKWLSVHVLALWILGTSWYTLFPAVQRRLPKPLKAPFRDDTPLSAQTRKRLNPWGIIGTVIAVEAWILGYLDLNTLLMPDLLPSNPGGKGAVLWFIRYGPYLPFIFVIAGFAFSRRRDRVSCIACLLIAIACVTWLSVTKVQHRKRLEAFDKVVARIEEYYAENQVYPGNLEELSGLSERERSLVVLIPDVSRDQMVSWRSRIPGFSFISPSVEAPRIVAYLDRVTLGIRFLYLANGERSAHFRATDNESSHLNASVNTQ